MPKKNSVHLQKLTSLLKISIFMAILKKPIIQNKLIFLNKMKRVKKLKLLRKYNSYYGYVREYEPSVRFHRKRISFKKTYGDVLFFSKCFGSGEEAEMHRLEMGFDGTEDSENLTTAIDLWEDESVDERAERFIQRFYEEMMRQREEMQ